MRTVVTFRRSLIRNWYIWDQRGVSAATSQRFLDRVTTPALMIWQTTRHLTAESRYPGKISTNKLMSLSAVHLAINDGRAG